jgi:hypothetical protein
MSMKITVVCGVIPFSMAEKYPHFLGTSLPNQTVRHELYNQ